MGRREGLGLMNPSSGEAGKEEEEEEEAGKVCASGCGDVVDEGEEEEEGGNDVAEKPGNLALEDSISALEVREAKFGEVSLS